MKKLTILSLLFVAIACEQNPDTLEGKKALLKEKQSEIGELQTEIKALKKEIAELDTAKTDEAPTLVELTKIKPAPFSHYVELTGTVSSEENIMVSAEASGRVVAIPAREGQRVGRGTTLVRLDNQTVSNQLAEAHSAYELAETTWNKRKKLWEEDKIGSEIEYLQAKSTYERAQNQYAVLQTQYSNSFIKAPINGTVDDIAVNEGEFVSAGSPIVRVVDLEKVEVEAEISEEYLPNVKKGDTVVVKIPALGIERKETVDFVGQVINPANRSFTVKVGLKNTDKLIKPNVLANLMIEDYFAPQAIVVPSIAIRRDLKGDFVFVAKKDGGSWVADKRYVKTGKAFNEKAEVIDGLNASDQVITGGFNQVSQGAAITNQ